MKFNFRTMPSLVAASSVLAAASCVVACSPALAAIDVGGVEFDDAAHVAGRSLKLNGGGISMRLIFKVYAMGLYLLDRRRTAEDVLASEGPRRLMIAMLRDVSGQEFDEAVMRSMADKDDKSDPDRDSQARIAGQMAQLVRAITSQPGGLRKGDLLTLDWVPGTGTVVELNRKPLTEPLRDIAFYNALLGIWLGDKPVDPLLKTRLLGRSTEMRAAAN
ncbi:hypothetical protein RD110_16545 [Rhodoferax koreense]|uniref:Chalcone isomerase domain-containing protein n=1 Tax=Rhodoferax koreensis TaxID=1842727 RepID=A0A1P8JXY9_9BURK|nr:chalcone isomerase family protein [Rhodoferax koreense]APW38608.1 hypothetical protein RD110_16545 [Rhodoferax koreense]